VPISAIIWKKDSSIAIRRLARIVMIILKVNIDLCKNVQCIPFDDSTNELNILSPNEKIYSSRSILLELESSKPS